MRLRAGGCQGLRLLACTIKCPSDHAICQMLDPENRRVSGTMERIIKDHKDAHDPQSRLTVSLAGISRADDGASLPVKVTTTWDLTLTNQAHSRPGDRALISA
jgi:hypothetical protein